MKHNEQNEMIRKRQDQNRPPDDPLAATGTIETQSLLTLLTPFLVFGALFVVLLLVWDR